MSSGNIRHISRLGFAVLIAGSILSGVILVILLFALDHIKQGQQITEDAYDSLFEIKYYTERLLTTENLKKEKRLLVDAGALFEARLYRMQDVRGEQSDDFNKLWTVVHDVMEDVLRQLENPLFQAGYTMDKSLLRRLGEGLNANERSDYYISLTRLVNSIDYLKQYEGFLIDELVLLRESHKNEVNAQLARAKNVAIFLPGSILLLTFVFANYSTREIGKVESQLIDAQSHLEESLKKLKDQKEALSYMAQHDALTHLPNRVLLLDRMEQMLHNAKENGICAAVLFIDLDRFKEVNDSLGHSRGDELLMLVARRLMENLREGDTLARLGGDEFVILLENLQSVAAIGPMAQDLISVMQRPIVLKEDILYITTSIGIAVYPNDGLDSETLLRNADAAMYRAKDEGRNTYRFYAADMTAAALERVGLETSMRRALERDEFVIYYQPQYEIRSDRLSGFEALIRWRHPERGLYLPSNFIPLAEESGLIVAIGNWVLRAACEQAVRWHSTGLQPGRVAVNVSERQLHSENFHLTLQAILKETGCRPEWMELEVTEGSFMRDPARSIPILESIVAMGFTLAIDDFGTGYSSLSYLKRLPVDRLKIDQSFVRGLPADADDVAITRAIIALGQEMNLSVTAEGVETAAQREFLLRESCAVAQGYYYALPMSTDETTRLLNLAKSGAPHRRAS